MIDTTIKVVYEKPYTQGYRVKLAHVYVTPSGWFSPPNWKDSQEINRIALYSNNPDNNPYNPGNDLSDLPYQMSGAFFIPLAQMQKDLYTTFMPYKYPKRKHQALNSYNPKKFADLYSDTDYSPLLDPFSPWRDLFQAALGLQNIAVGISRIVVGLVGLVGKFLYNVGYFIGNFSLPESGPSMVLPASWVVEGSMRLVQGALQIATSPLSLVKWCIRSIVTAATDGLYYEDRLSTKREMDEILPLMDDYKREDDSIKFLEGQKNNPNRTLRMPDEEDNILLMKDKRENIGEDLKKRIPSYFLQRIEKTESTAAPRYPYLRSVKRDGINGPEKYFASLPRYTQNTMIKLDDERENPSQGLR